MQGREIKLPERVRCMYMSFDSLVSVASAMIGAMLLESLDEHVRTNLSFSANHPVTPSFYRQIPPGKWRAQYVQHAGVLISIVRSEVERGVCGPIPLA